MNKKYEEFVGCLRDELMKCLGKIKNFLGTDILKERE